MMRVHTSIYRYLYHATKSVVFVVFVFGGG